MKLHFLVSLLLLACTSSFGQSWQQVADFPGNARDDGIAVVIGNKAYCGTGFLPWWVASNDLYAFDMTTGVWTSEPGLPEAQKRQYALAFPSSGGNKGFIFGGEDGSTFFNDLWEITPGSAPVQIGTAPFSGRSGCAHFTIQGETYVIGGRTQNQSALAEVWRYTESSNSWTQMNDLPFPAWRAAGASLDGSGYLLFGRDSTNVIQNDLYEYDPASDSWAAISTFPGSGRTHASMVAMNGVLLVLGGSDSAGTYYNDLQQFDPQSSNWQSLTALPAAPRRGGVAFHNSASLFYTTGLDDSQNKLKETWKLFSPTSTDETISLANWNIYPNPASERLYFRWDARTSQKGTKVEIYTSQGQLQFQERKSFGTSVDLSGWQKGLYFIRVSRDQKYSTRPFIIQ